MKKIVAAVILLFFSYSGAFAADAPAPAPDPYHDWFTYYYIASDTSKVPAFLKWLQDSGTLEKAATTAPIEGFLSSVFAANGTSVDGWVHSDAFTGKTKETIDHAVKPKVAPDKIEIKNISDIERAWGSFYATGSDQYLLKIVNVLDTDSTLEGDKKQAETTRAAAAWSLGSNMTQHELVDRFLSAESEKRTGAVGDTLKKIVGDVRKQREARTFPHSDGEFSAVMFVTDPDVAAKEFSAASNGSLHMKAMPHTKIGDKRTIVILFAGQQLMPDLNSDVTYDAQLLDPDGKVYADHKGLTAIKGKLPTRFRVYYNLQAMFIAFDKKDKFGTYKISVTLNDNIGKKSIPLTSEIIFKKK